MTDLVVYGPRWGGEVKVVERNPLAPLSHPRGGHCTAPRLPTHASLEPKHSRHVIITFIAVFIIFVIFIVINVVTVFVATTATPCCRVCERM